MPTERFAALADSKKQRIRDAVISEFTRTSYGELQFSKIARSAQVSRASLYTYFRDKEDLFRFALQESRKNLRKPSETIIRPGQEESSYE